MALSRMSADGSKERTVVVAVDVDVSVSAWADSRVDDTNLILEDDSVKCTPSP